MISSYDVLMRHVAILLVFPLAALAAPLRVVVDDATRARVAQAEVTLTCAPGPGQKARTDDSGTAVFSGGASTACQVAVIAIGFQPWRGSAAAGAEQLDAHLTVLQPGTQVVVDGARPKSPMTRFVNWLTSCTRR